MTNTRTMFKSRSGWTVLLVTSFSPQFSIVEGDRREFDTFRRYFQINDERKTGSGFCDYPCRYDNGQIAYDYPERIPAYVKKQVKKAYQNAGAFLY